MHAKLLLLCLIICDPVDCRSRTEAPLSKGFSKQEYQRALPGPPPGGLPHPRTGTASLMSPALAGRFFTWEAQKDT